MEHHLFLGCRHRGERRCPAGPDSEEAKAPIRTQQVTGRATLLQLIFANEDDGREQNGVRGLCFLTLCLCQRRPVDANALS
jgi:hypothetical protein